MPHSLTVLTASEIAEFGGYCPQAWWLRRQGVVGAPAGALRRAEGIALHRQVGQQTDQLRAAETGARVGWRVGILLALLAAGALLVALATQGTHAWAATLPQAGFEAAAPSTGTGLPEIPLAVMAVAGLFSASAFAVALAIWFDGRARRWRTTLGLTDAGQGARVLAADDSKLGALTLWSEQLGVMARPDHVVRLADGVVIPVEHKPRAHHLYRSYLLELGTQLLLVEACFGRRPPYGIVVLADGAEHQIAFDRELESAVRAVIARMRAYLSCGTAPGRRWLGAKCRACEYHDRCWGGSA